MQLIREFMQYFNSRGTKIDLDDPLFYSNVVFHS